MPVLHHDDYSPPCQEMMPAVEILHRRSINSLLGLQQADASPFARVPLMDEFPNSPEGGQIPLFSYMAAGSDHNLSECDTMVDSINMIQPDSSDSNVSSPSTCSQFEGSILDMMSELSIRPPNMAASEYHPSQMSEATCTWRGALPCRVRFPSNTFSPKIFLGGLPWDVDEKTLIHTFKRFGPIRVDWPGKENNTPQPKGFVYIIFQTERQVKYLLAASTYDATGNWYFTISTKKMRAKQVQIIPWDLKDSNYFSNFSAKLDPSRTVFVGALHGMLTAEGLAKIMNDLFGGVVFAGIDTDKYKYPIGSGRVTFDNFHSYVNAVNAAFINVKTEKFYKKIQVDPYLEDSICSVCNIQQGPYFCRTPSCFRYFCRSCWQWRHPRDCHKPLTRSKSSMPLNVYNYNGQKYKSQPQQQIAADSQPYCTMTANNLCSHAAINRLYNVNFNGTHLQEI